MCLDGAASTPIESDIAFSVSHGANRYCQKFSADGGVAFVCECGTSFDNDATTEIDTAAYTNTMILVAEVVMMIVLI